VSSKPRKSFHSKNPRLIIPPTDFTTFDIVSDLAFGEPLYCLRDSIEHKWISITVRGLTAIALHVSRSKSLFFRSLDKLRSFFTDNSGPARARLELAVRARDMVTKRLRKIESGEENARADFFSYIIKNQEKETTRLTRAEMDSNAVSFLLAGTETSATALAGTTFLLLRNPTAYRKLVTEIRSRFSSADQISVDEVGKLDYLVAVLHEGMRYYPPAATGLARVVPAGGDVISGRYIPGGATVYISMPATGRSARNFRDPDEFVPERWLGDERFEGDRRAAHQPFSFGPRNCIGKTYVLPLFSHSVISPPPPCLLVWWRGDEKDFKLMLLLL
jgi:cytochrome P450